MPDNNRFIYAVHALRLTARLVEAKTDFTMNPGGADTTVVIFFPIIR